MHVGMEKNLHKRQALRSPFLGRVLADLHFMTVRIRLA